ncbi:MAG TPA: hypothetical protein VFC92_07855 [Bacteroidales bacterium]|nr:hypothetical protein [Bacteroidales bacterium]
MEAIFKLNVKQIDGAFVEAIKKMFNEKDVIIRISTPLDETEYLLSSEANERHILENSVAEPAMQFTAEEFRKYADKTLKP